MSISIHGKEYVEVKDRVQEFNKDYPNGSIRTEIVELTKDTITIKATVIPDIEKLDRYFNGFAQEWKTDSKINQTAMVENCETSAVGRALGMMGIGIVESIASADEVKKAINHEGEVVSAPVEQSDLITEKQRGMIFALYMEKNGVAMPIEEQEKIKKLSKMQASELITKWKEAMPPKEEKAENVEDMLEGIDF